jgi:DNA-binding XRE family transcriptional regulator
MFTSTFAILLVFITLPIIFLFWLTESQHVKVKRMYRSGRYSQQQLADIFGVSRSTIRRRLAAA